MARQPQPVSGTPTMSTQGRAAPQAEEEKVPFFQRPGVGNALDSLAIALQGMTIDPNEGLMQLSANRIADRRKTARTEQQQNRTIEALRNMGAPPQIIQMAEAGYGREAMSQMAQMARGPEYRQITGEEAAAMNLDPTKAYNVGQDGKITGIGGSGDTFNIGGQPTSPGWEAIDKKYAETWLSDSTSGLADVANQAAQISDVLKGLESGEQFTGPLVGAQPDFVRAVTNPEAQDAKDRVEQVVQRSLRETLGAQFTEAEGNRLIARAYNVNLPPEQNIARLRALFESLNATAQQKLAMREYFNEKGTLQGFNGGMNIPNVDDFIGIMDAAAPGAPQRGGEGGATHRFNPETGQVEEIQ